MVFFIFSVVTSFVISIYKDKSKHFLDIRGVFKILGVYIANMATFHFLMISLMVYKQKKIKRKIKKFFRFL